MSGLLRTLQRRRLLRRPLPPEWPGYLNRRGLRASGLCPAEPRREVIFGEPVHSPGAHAARQPSGPACRREAGARPVTKPNAPLYQEAMATRPLPRLPLALLLGILLPLLASANARLSGGQTLAAGQELVSKNGRYRLLMQDDGNLVLYAPRGLPLWDSKTTGKSGAALTLQADGNAVVYAGGQAVWSSHTYGHPGSSLLLQDDGNVVVYSAGGAALWSSQTALTPNRQVRVFDFNISGNLLNAGKTGPTNGKPGVVEAIASSIASFQPDVVTLQEVCENQYNELRRLTGMHGRMAQQNTVGGCGGSFGSVVLTREPILRENRWVLPGPDGDEARKLLCVETRTVMGCSAHLTPGNEAKQDEQIQFIARTLAPYTQAGVAVALGMDAYEEPHELGSLNQIGLWMAPGGPSHKNDNGCDLAPVRANAAEDCRGPLRRKLDHVLFNSKRFSSLRGETTTTRHSDHLPVRGTATLGF